MLKVTPDLLLQAYSAGVFPMAESHDDPNLYWVDPDWRGIIPLDRFRVPRRLRRVLRRAPFEVRADTAFAKVIRSCARRTPERPTTWINDEIIRLYTELQEMDHAHSVECWRDGTLVGGLYGVAIGGAFFGESMFSRVPDASKVALVHLVARLRRGGFVLLDTQFVTPHLRQFGAVEIPRSRYRVRLAAALKVQARFHRELDPSEVSEFWQSSTQTS